MSQQVVVGMGQPMHGVYTEEYEKFKAEHRVVETGYLRWVQLGLTGKEFRSGFEVPCKHITIGLRIPGRKKTKTVKIWCSFARPSSPSHAEIETALAKTNLLWSVVAVIDVQHLLMHAHIRAKWEYGNRVYVPNPLLHVYGKDFYKRRAIEGNRKKHKVMAELYATNQRLDMERFMSAHHYGQVKRLTQELDEYKKTVKGVLRHLETVGQPTVSTQAVLDLLNGVSNG